MGHRVLWGAEAAVEHFSALLSCVAYVRRFRALFASLQVKTLNLGKKREAGRANGRDASRTAGKRNIRD
jgi:hypothetical protein